MVKKISQEEFEQVKNDDIAVIDFSAEWCGPCKMLAPVMDEVSEELGDSVSFYNIDVDQHGYCAAVQNREHSGTSGIEEG